MAQAAPTAPNFIIIGIFKPTFNPTPKKVRNENYADFGIIPIEISSRNILAKEFETNGIELLVNEISKDNSNNKDDKKQINSFFHDNFF